MNNVRNLATYSPDYPALNGISAYLNESPMKGKLHMAIKEKLEEMLDTYDD